MSPRWHFAAWSFHAQSHVLETGPFSTTLEPKVARLLLYLLEHNGEVLSHDELVAAVWDNRVISDEAVRRAVSQLRHVLARDGSDRYLKTVRKQGYLPQFPLQPSRFRKRWRGPLRWWLSASVAAVAALTLAAALTHTPGNTPGPLAQKPPATQAQAQREYLAARALIGTFSHADLERAMRHLRNAIVLDPGLAHAYTLLAEALLTRANDNDREDFGATLLAARPLVERALALDPDLADAWVLRARLIADSDAAQAEAHLRHAMRLNPGASQPWEVLASYLMLGGGRDDEAADLIDHAIALEPTRARNYHLKTYLVLRDCDLQTAEALARQALVAEPAFRASLVLLGRMAAGRGELAEALHLHEQAYGMDTRSDWIRQTLHQSWLSIGFSRGALSLGMSGQPAARWRELFYQGDLRGAASAIEQADTYQLRHVRGWEVVESLRLAAEENEPERERWRRVLTRHWGFTGELPARHRREEIPLLMSSLQLWHGPELPGPFRANLRDLYGELLADHRRQPRCHPAGEPLALILAALALGERQQALALFRSELRGSGVHAEWHWLLRSHPDLLALSRDPDVVADFARYQAGLSKQRARLYALVDSGQVPNRGLDMATGLLTPEY
ncbi:MAG: hypothetical protein CME40_01065 [Haliea sp.]|nr:hypothetical protein [Haliea sp.]|tara:strand:+ start:116220 stop:118079 length:1860 start_codon:yes stop_codon:yes gene_type:complete